MGVALVRCVGVAVYRGMTVPLGAAMAFRFAGLYFTYSQSSYFAVAAGVLAVGTGLWSRRVTIALVVAGAAGLLAVVAVALRGNSANRVSDERSHLIRLGWRVIRHHPALGAGLSGLPKAAVAGTAHPFRVKGAASHTTPVTVAAELGPIGFALYLWVLAAVTAAGARIRGAGPVPRVLLGALTVGLWAFGLRRGGAGAHWTALRDEVSADRWALAAGTIVFVAIAVVRLRSSPLLNFEMFGPWRYWADGLEIADAGRVPAETLQWGSTWTPTVSKVVLNSYHAALSYAIGRAPLPAMGALLWLASTGLAAGLSALA